MLPALPVKPDDGQRESQPAGQVHHQRPQRVALRLLGLRVTDQQERAERGDFPEQEQPHQVVGENEAEHRAHEDEQQREEKRTPVRNVAMGHLVVFAHVAQRIKADAAAHHAVDQGHDDGELVHEQILRHLQMRAGGQFKPDHQPRLRQREQHDQQMFRAHADVNNEQAHRDLDEQHAQVDPVLTPGKVPRLSGVGNRARATEPQQTASVTPDTRILRGRSGFKHNSTRPAARGTRINVKTSITTV